MCFAPAVPSVPEYASIVAVLRSSVASFGILSRMVLKSVALIAPLMVRLVTMFKLSPAVAMATESPPGVFTTTVRAWIAPVRSNPRRIEMYFFIY